MLVQRQGNTPAAALCYVLSIVKVAIVCARLGLTYIHVTIHTLFNDHKMLTLQIQRILCFAPLFIKESSLSQICSHFFLLYISSFQRQGKMFSEKSASDTFSLTLSDF
jgi:hypothetical protein